MKKKLCAFVLCMALISGAAFTMERTIGGGILYYAGTSSGRIDDPWFGPPIDWQMRRDGIGAFAFLGLSRFWEFNLGLLYKYPWNFVVDGVSVDTWDIEGTMALQLGVYWKYPILIPAAPRFVFFPTVGVDIEFSLSADDWWHDVWLRAGVGLDFFIRDTMFLRGHLIYGAAIPFGGEPELGLNVGHGFLTRIGIGFMF